MQFHLRTLLILLAFGPPVLAGIWLIGAWIVGQYSSPVAERLVIFAVTLMIGIALVMWSVLARSADVVDRSFRRLQQRK